jgi:hypothetical protein
MASIRLDSILIETSITLPQQVNIPTPIEPSISFIGQNISARNGMYQIEKEYKETKEEPLFIRVNHYVSSPPQTFKINVLATVLLIQVIAICICIGIYG